MASLDPSSFTLSLRPKGAQGADDEPVARLVERIYEERGHFRNVTEDSLQAEIEAQERGEASSSVGDDGDGETVADDKRKREELVSAKVEMLKQLGSAANEALTALDFVSLLESRAAPQQAMKSMSPLLQQLVPTGSLGFDKWQMPPPDPAKQRKDEAVSHGWRAQNLESSADSLLKAASRLESEVKKETRYWEQVLSIKEKGWPVSRVPQEKHMLGVHFGFGEAAPYFRQRGFSPLRRNADGGIEFDPTLTDSPKALRVRIVENGEIRGTSQIPTLVGAMDPSIDELIRRAKDSLFEQELHHEILLETWQLLPYNVTVKDSAINVPLGSPDSLTRSHGASTLGAGRSIRLDLVAIEQELPEISSNAEDPLAEEIACVLRLLLAETHRQRLLQKSEPPPPLSDKRRPAIEATILRPILSHFYHMNASHSILQHMESLSKALNRAGMACKFAISTEYGLPDLSLPGLRRNTKLSAGDKLIRSLRGPIFSLSSFSLPSSASVESKDITIAIRTHISAQSFGTEYALHVPASISKILRPDEDESTSSPSRFMFTSGSEACEYLDFLLSLDVAHFVVSKYKDTLAGVDYVPEAENNKARLKVEFSEGRLNLAWVRKGKSMNTKKVVWAPEGGEVRSLKQVLREVLDDT
ncbi:subunit 17 of mediator complex-domain-containing protein [Lineolata rhizophorae]|uniref:Mediator of RNA polymerase II transcription subunit 17 n=1 Tax=Lineolata rhizophorae TaxID=578093 RepID=A0A6A6P319_9PEZI|nr:subunit 17 of mediator complex-domain-containing protein [Lineolata rhizophorae]